MKKTRPETGSSDSHSRNTAQKTKRTDRDGGGTEGSGSLDARYRISDYAKNMGVTPDLLKHYEEIGLLEPERSEKGYRYYPFGMSSLLIESIRLRNYGFTLRETKDLLRAGTKPEEKTLPADQQIRQQMEIIRMNIRTQQAILADYEEFASRQDTIRSEGKIWYIAKNEEYAFLPHAEGDRFIQDERIRELMPLWINCVPVVKSALSVDSAGRSVWGLITKSKYLKQLSIPVNDAVEIIPPQRTFVYCICGEMLLYSKETLENPQHPVRQVLDSLGINSAERMLRVSVMPSDWTNPLREQFYYYIVPLEQ